MNIPSDAIIYTLENGTSICWLDKLPPGIKWKRDLTSSSTVYTKGDGHPDSSKPMAVFVVPATLSIEFTEALACKFLEDIGAIEQESGTTEAIEEVSSTIRYVLAYKPEQDMHCHNRNGWRCLHGIGRTRMKHERRTT